MVSDFHEQLEEKLNKRLAHDKRLAPYALKARVYEDGLVRIQGIVDVLEEKRQAEEILKEYPGVEKIENNITVCTDGGIDDEDVAFEVGEELRANPVVPDSIGVKVSGGQVQLVGSIQNQKQALEAIETAAKARGVREIKSQLKYSVALDDASITNNVQTALTEHAEIIPGRIRVLTKDGVVGLWGNVSEEESKRAIETAVQVQGVKAVENHLKIEKQTRYEERV